MQWLESTLQIFLHHTALLSAVGNYFQLKLAYSHFKVMFANMLVLSLPAVLIQYQFVVSKNSTALTLW
jgi:hypothetical protein